MQNRDLKDISLLKSRKLTALHRQLHYVGKLFRNVVTNIQSFDNGFHVNISFRYNVPYNTHDEISVYFIPPLLSFSHSFYLPPPPSPSNSWIILAYPSLWMTGVSVWDSAALSSSSSRARSSAERFCTAGFWCAFVSMSVRLLYKINKVFSSRTRNYSRCHYWWLF